MKKSLFSETEREHLVNALQTFSATNEKTAKELLTKIKAIFQTKTSDWFEVDFSDWIQSNLNQDLFNTIKDAIFEKVELSFHYVNNQGQFSERNVQPYKLVFKSKNWYLYGFCLLRKDFRFFKLTRINKLTKTTNSFTPIYVPTTIRKIINHTKKITVTLKFEKEIAFRVYDEFSENISEDAQGNLYVKVELPNTDTLYSYLLSFIDHVEVLEPQFVRTELKDKLAKIIKLDVRCQVILSIIDL